MTTTQLAAEPAAPESSREELGPAGRRQSHHDPHSISEPAPGPRRPIPSRRPAATAGHRPGRIDQAAAAAER